MTYEEAVAIVKSAAPALNIMEDGSKSHVALQKAAGDTPFCIAIPDSSHLFSGPGEAEAAEKTSLLTSIQQYVARA